MVLASGTQASLRYSREAVPGTTPAGIGTPVDVVATAVGDTGDGDFTRAAGSWVDDGFAVGQTVRASGFTDTDVNTDWVVSAVTATDLTVIDVGDVIGAEAGDAGNFVQIVLKKLRATGRNINLEKDVLESEEVDPDGQETDVRHGFNRVVGSPGFQLSRGDYEEWLELVAQSSFYAVTTTGTPDLGVTESSNQFTRATGSFITDGYRVGDIIRTSSFANGVNNGDWRVTVVAALALTVLEPTGVVLVDETEAASKSLTLVGKRLDIETSLVTMIVERAFSDVGKFQVFNGVAIDGLQLSVQPESIIGGTFNLIGLSAAAMASASVSAVTPAAATANSPFAAFDGALYEGGVLNAVATAMEFTLARNLTLNPVIGSKFSPAVFKGQANINGTLTVFFEDETLFNKFVNETESSIWNKFLDPTDSNHFMNIVLPRVKYNGGPMDPPQEGPVPIEMPFRALKATGLVKPTGATINSMMSIQSSAA